MGVREINLLNICSSCNGEGSFSFFSESHYQTMKHLFMAKYYRKRDTVLPKVVCKKCNGTGRNYDTLPDLELEESHLTRSK